MAHMFAKVKNTCTSNHMASNHVCKIKCTTHTHLSIWSICRETILLTISSALSFIIYTCKTILGGIVTDILRAGTPKTGLFGTDALEMETTNTIGDTTSNGKRQRFAGDSPSKNSKKKKEKGTSICPICLENIVEATKTRQGQDSHFLWRQL